MNKIYETNTVIKHMIEVKHAIPMPKKSEQEHKPI